ncbi:sugar transferase, partial [Turicibacter sanguinis]|nr:sugar transferase [Turicibacter sanguinis]
MQQIVKRAIEFIIVLVGLVVASPILLVVAILVKTKLGSPIIFRQQRVGLNGDI